MTDHEFHRRLSAVADAAESEIDRYDQQLTRIREELVAQSRRADRRRARAKLVGHMRENDLLREAKLIESVVGQIRKAIG